MKYVPLTEIFPAEKLEKDLLQQLLSLPFVRSHCPSPQEVQVADEDCDTLRTMVRLAVDLEINPAGIETIMHMRHRIQQLQHEVRALKAHSNAYTAMRGPLTGDTSKL